jgi:hypothetical protein
MEDVFPFLGKWCKKHCKQSISIAAQTSIDGQNEGNALMTRTLKLGSGLAPTDCPTPFRAAVYLRVSTGRPGGGRANGLPIVDRFVGQPLCTGLDCFDRNFAEETEYF